MTERRPRISHSIRFRPEDLAEIQAHHLKTKPQHGLSFNQWVVETLLKQIGEVYDHEHRATGIPARGNH